MTNTNDTMDTAGLTRAERRYVKTNAQMENSLKSWRTPARRAFLVRANWISIALMAVISVVGYFWFPIVIAFIPMTAVLLVAWTMLRVTIDSKDSAPARFLDEFEAATLLEARSTALKYTSALLAIIALVLIFGASLEIGSDSGALGDGFRFSYAMGGLALMAFLVSHVIPAAAMVKTMDDESER